MQTKRKSLNRKYKLVRQTVKKPGKRLSNSKKLKKTVHKSRPLHKRFLLHPFSIMVVLGVGVLLVGTTFHIYADSYNVTAEISAPIPRSPAIIHRLADQTHFTSPQINVIGTCPTNTYVNLHTNGIFSGASLCSSGNTFQITTDLSSGSNSIRVQDYNVTDQAGPTSPGITVYYDQPVSTPIAQGPVEQVPVSKPSSKSQTNSSTASPFYIKTTYQYQAYETDQLLTLNLMPISDTPPFAWTISWGDGHLTTLLTQDGSTITPTHSFSAVGNYVVKIQITDSKGLTRLVQLPEIIKGPTLRPVSISLSAPKKPASSSISNAKHWLWAVWPAYLVLILMVSSFWLGERQEYRGIMTRRKQKGHAHAR